MYHSHINNKVRKYNAARKKGIGKKKIKKLLKIFSLLLFFSLSVVSCVSTKLARPGHKTTHLSALNYLKAAIEEKPPFQALSSKMKFSLTIEGKEMAVNGNLRIKRNKIIQISFVPLLGIEVARIEITPEQILILDRMNKRYVEAPVSLLKSLANTDLDFYALQALFLNELFIPGNKQLSEKDIKDFTIKESSGNEIIFQLQEKKNLNYSFVTSLLTGTLMESSITAGSNNRLDWQYGEFRNFEKKDFPTAMNIILKRGTKTGVVNLHFSRMNTKGDWEIQTNIPSKYQRISIDEFIKVLFSL